MHSCSIKKSFAILCTALIDLCFVYRLMLNCFCWLVILVILATVELFRRRRSTIFCSPLQRIGICNLLSFSLGVVFITSIILALKCYGYTFLQFCLHFRLLTTFISFLCLPLTTVLQMVVYIRLHSSLQLHLSLSLSRLDVVLRKRSLPKFSHHLRTYPPKAYAFFLLFG